MRLKEMLARRIRQPTQSEQTDDRSHYPSFAQLEYLLGISIMWVRSRPFFSRGKANIHFFLSIVLSNAGEVIFSSFYRTTAPVFFGHFMIFREMQQVFESKQS